MLQELYSKRIQTHTWTDNIPSKELINSLLKKTYETVPSKQNLIPYQIIIWGPNVKKNDFRDFCRYGSGHMDTDFKKGTVQLLAPYVLFFCTREINDANEMIKRTMKNGHPHKILQEQFPQHVVGDSKRICLEIGMFSSLLTGFCMEENLSVSYTLCMPPPKYKVNKKWIPNHEWKMFGFQPGQVLFSMSIGYSDQENSGRTKDEVKPPIDNILNWVK